MGQSSSAGSDPDAGVLKAKIDLRASAKTRRASLSAVERQDGATRLAALDLAAILGPLPRVVSAFHSMGEELDTGPLLRRLAALGYVLALPVMHGRGLPLVFRQWSSGDAMATAVWGIQEPTADKAALEPDVVLVPLLAFDRAGWRLGYGGGFYDRTLRGLRTRKPVRVIGVAFAEQEVDAVPHLDYDERLDAVLTPQGLVEFT